ncbi:ribonuclease D [uncultured Brevundimonas sp.]|uniref:ribonuclease D n=1 Tax=uncultured Brevundimonas sp. TaxID=213418 RepID=UPI0030EE1111|tara:strand:+ start:46910 stop:48067 length:1158 start_codon:yes stop_codon:yes gene_type:complete
MTPITTNDALVEFCARLAKAPFIAVDTEFMRETTYWPKLCLIQAASATDEANIDPLAEGLDLEPFLDLLRNPDIIKVFHAARQDTEIFVKLGAMPAPMFDTQVAAMAAGFGDQVSYEALVRQMLKQEIDKGSRFTDWSRRPLSDAQLVYAIGDVTHLATLYPKLRDRLEKAGRLGWVTSEMAGLIDPDLYDTTPDKAWKRLKPKKYSAKYLAAFKATAVWREQAAQERDQPRGRILKDDAIDEIAAQGPTDAEAFNRLRSVPKGFGGSRLGAELIVELKRVLADPEAHAPKLDRPSHNQPAPPSVVELLKVLLKAKSDNAGVATKLIGNVADLEKIALDDNAPVDALKGWRRELFGEDALKLKRGEIALVLNGARVEVVEIEAEG